ncbi:MAG: HAMP domain-containing histidine kinase [Prevotella sp.]|nr:HAMP domain-containing histidine kinase [Prevotella sp.]
MIWYVGIAIILVLLLWLTIHQRRLKRRAWLMQEAMRNRDFTFRLSTHGLLPGERAMQEALNQLGSTIRQQVSQNEVESWERLTRVLTHEIMNATAPITSITQSMLGRDDVKGTPLEEGIRAIHTTSSHLNTFVDSYRRFSQLQKITPVETRLSDVVADIRQLYPSLEWEVDIPGTLTVVTDQTMLRQVLINLVKNAIEARARRIGIEGKAGNDTVELNVSNDGSPIPIEARTSVFIPFFTTKSGGSGIGLSLSRRMMTLQGGSLELLERPCSSYHTTFMLRF